jgi:hypothetical protein
MKEKNLRESIEKNIGHLICFENHEAEKFGYIKPTVEQIEILKTINLLFSLKEYFGADFDKTKSNICKVYGKEEKLLVHPEFNEKVEGFFRKAEILTHPEQKYNNKVYSIFFNKLADYLGHEENNKISLWERIGDVAFEEQKLNLNKDDKKCFKRDKIDFSKPVTIYFGGVIDFSEKKGFIARTLERTQRLLNVVGISNEQSSVYGIAYSNYSALRKCSYTNSYNSDPENFYSPYAENFVKINLTDIIEEDGKKIDPQRLKLKFSKITFLGYSYGTIFVQEVRNCLVDKMQKLNYSEQEIVDCIDQISALNIGSTCRIVEKKADFTQMHLTSEKDEMTSARTNNTTLLINDKNEHLKHALVGNNLLLHSVDSLDFAPALKINLTNDGEVKIKEESIKVERGHHPVLYMRGNRRREGIQTFQANIASDIGANFLKDVINASWEAEKNQIIRKGPALLGEIIEENLSTENIEKLSKDRLDYLNIYEILKPKSGKSRTISSI